MTFNQSRKCPKNRGSSHMCIALKQLIFIFDKIFVR